MREIPISAAKRIADDFGYDQVVIYARKVGSEPEPYGEHMTTYGRTPEHCGACRAHGRNTQEVHGLENLNPPHRKLDRFKKVTASLQSGTVAVFFSENMLLTNL